MKGVVRDFTASVDALNSAVHQAIINLNVFTETVNKRLDAIEKKIDKLKQPVIIPAPQLPNPVDPEYVPPYEITCKSEGDKD